MVVVLIRSNHIGGVKVCVHGASVVDSGNYHQQPLSTALPAFTLTCTPPMWLLLIQLPSTPTIYNTPDVYTNFYTTDVVTSNQYNYHQHPLSTALVNAGSAVDSGC
jgi:hypothetical protein